jgi:oligoribonuclease NrnB/cAMP/cGMP phosphodiesterase (DHH superfamily)
MNYCLYHASCYDGFCAAFVVWLKFKDDLNWKFIAVRYQEECPLLNKDLNFNKDLNKDSRVYIVDFSYPRDVLEKLYYLIGDNLHIYDHHLTAEKDLKGLNYCVFDQNESGVSLTWKQLFPDRLLPLILQYVRDADLWKFELPNSKDINQGLRSVINIETNLFYIDNFKLLDNIIVERKEDFLYEKGATINEYRAGLIKECLPHVEIFNWKIACPITYGILTYKIGMINLGVYNILSDLGHEILKNEIVDLAFLYVVNFKKQYISVSLRSRVFIRNGINIDCGAIAKKFGGGGHANAAGFRIPIEQFYSLDFN